MQRGVCLEREREREGAGGGLEGITRIAPTKLYIAIAAAAKDLQRMYDLLGTMISHLVPRGSSFQQKPSNTIYRAFLVNRSAHRKLNSHLPSTFSRSLRCCVDRPLS